MIIIIGNNCFTLCYYMIENGKIYNLGGNFFSIETKPKPEILFYIIFAKYSGFIAAIFYHKAEKMD